MRTWLLLSSVAVMASLDCPAPHRGKRAVPDAASVTIGLYPGVPASWNDEIVSSLRKVGSPADDVEHKHWPTGGNQVEQFLSEISIYRALRRSRFFEPQPEKADFLYVPLFPATLRSWKDCGCMPRYRFNKVERNPRAGNLSDPAMQAYCPQLLWQCPGHTKMGNLPWLSSLMSLLDGIMASELWQRSNGSNFIWSIGRSDVYRDPAVPPARDSDPMHRALRDSIWATGVPYRRDPNDWVKNIMMPLGVHFPRGAASKVTARRWHMCFSGRTPALTQLTDRSVKWSGADWMITNGSWVRRYRADQRASMGAAVRSDQSRYRFNDKRRDRPEYIAWLHECTFCYAPHGDGPATARLYESIAAGCIPVMWSYGNHEAFKHLLDYHDVAIVVPYNESISAADVLRMVDALSPADVARRQAALARVSAMFQMRDLYGRPSDVGQESIEDMGSYFWQQAALQLSDVKAHAAKARKPFSPGVNKAFYVCNNEGYGSPEACSASHCFARKDHGAKPEHV